MILGSVLDHRLLFALYISHEGTVNFEAEFCFLLLLRLEAFWTNNDSRIKRPRKNQHVVYLYFRGIQTSDITSSKEGPKDQS